MSSLPRARSTPEQAAKKQHRRLARVSCQAVVLIQSKLEREGGVDNGPALTEGLSARSLRENVTEQGREGVNQ